MPRADTGPMPRANTGPFPRADPAGRDPWDGAVPGYEFEGRRPARAPRRNSQAPGWDTPPSRPRPAEPRTAEPRPAEPRTAEPRTAEPGSGGTGSVGGEPRRFRYTQTVSQPMPVQAPPRAQAPPLAQAPPPAQAPLPAPVASPSWPAAAPPEPAGFEFGRQVQDAAPTGTVPPAAARSGARPPGSREAIIRVPEPPRGPGSGPGPAWPERRDEGTAAAEWARLLRSMLPPPVKRRWSREFLAGLDFGGWGVRVAIPILAMVVFGVAVVVIARANSGNAGPTPPATALGFPPATLAGNDFTAAAGDRGISQTLGRVASSGDEIVAVGSQSGARIARAQFFVSADGGRSWTMGTVRTAGGGVPPPGHGAVFVAGGQGAWVALGDGAIWTSADGRTWTLAPGDGLPMLPGDHLGALQRTAAGFIAVGANVPGGDQAMATPVVFLSANGTSWQRLDAARLRLAAGPGRVLDLRYAAASGKLILIAGDVVTAEGSGKPRRTVRVQSGAAWLSRDGGTTWTPVAVPARGPGLAAPPRVAGVAAAGGGFVLLRPATVAGRPAVDIFFSPNGLAWTFTATLHTAAGFTASMANGGPDGAVVAGQAGRTLTAFSSANGRTWRQAQSLGAAASQAISGVTLARDGTVVTAGVSAPPDSRQPVLTLAAPGAGASQVDIAKIPGAVDQQLTVNALAAQGGTQVAAGGADGFPAVWISPDGGSTWSRAAGASPAVFGRAGTQQLTSVTHGIMGWLAVGGVVSSAAEHPVVVVSADGTSWQAADGERAFAGPGLFTVQAAANGQGYVIVGYQKIRTNPGARPVIVAAAWWSAGLAGWQRAGDAAAGALDGPGARQMLAVTAGPAGFVAGGSHGDQPSAWTSADGRTWRQADLPVPAGAVQAVLQHVASTGRIVAAVGTAVTAAGRSVPFAARSADGGLTWTESALPAPGGLTSVTALAAAGGAFTATGTYGSTPSQQDVVVWTSPDGKAWRADRPSGQGLTGAGIQAITTLAATGSTLTGVGFTATPLSEQPVFWQSPIR